jgi:hypothetical protein
MQKAFAGNNVTWIKPGPKEWLIDLDGFSELVQELRRFAWFKGKIALEPDFEARDKSPHFNASFYEANFVFYITPETLLASEIFMRAPAEIHDSLERFQQDHPHPSKVAFIMMQFGKTKAHEAIVAGIRSALKAHGVEAVRADDKDYHDNVFPNIQTYIFGCGFGIAVFERLESDQFNPNVSLEVGYMLALGKPVCLLKDATLKTLATDLVGKLYKAFDTQDPGGSIPDQILKWCMDRRLV